jgi:small subunit ribosomal protein S2
VFVIDLKKEQLAVREARRLGVPVVGLVDTNADPDEADYVIPGNDDAIRSCNLVTRVVADGVEAGTAKVTPAELTAELTAEPEESAPQEAAADEAAEPEVEAEAAQPEPAAVANGGAAE